MFAEFMFIALAVCLLLGTCPEARLAYGMSFGALLEQAFTIIAIDWISLTILKSLARAKVRAKHIALAFLWRCCGLTAMS